ncbi:TauD/TfdA dioxygenase family protein [Marinomonas mediterranea]|jgi:Probable taurine catabolism dioxygenase|uniref:Taurine dioxygenase n=1 Tax=Marinomonas mediterranea (strain ATCC 700492 / JCM 21426 / NBRC 103028 / MMB-1) TaxID=717774 RepID=F2JXG5_MARM1|nr:TauD/TfdA family dioxygenase [Marinomonas mediterranea]ADZ91865.1 Taurine dioxygenase [Marinomonas mediterranea MMB-1]WCN17959.1 taurine catabolism dioxygenase [Marinomonas mediterranea MMB-1]
MKITPLSRHIGAEISELQLNDLSEHEFSRLYSAFLEYKVLFFRDQELTPDQHFALGQRFGELEPPHPFFPHVESHPQIVVIETSRGNPPGESFWHTDMTFQRFPPKCSILHAQYVPERGGDTLWCSMAAVWQSLPESRRQTLKGLEACHQLHAFKNSRYDQTNEQGESIVDEKSAQYPPVFHPLMYVHPETQEETLFINEQFTRYIDGMTPLDSEACLQELFEIARQDVFQVRFSWKAGSVAIWDNRVTQHFAVTDYGDTPRKLHRVTVKGAENNSD